MCWALHTPVALGDRCPRPDFTGEKTETLSRVNVRRQILPVASIGCPLHPFLRV